MGASRLLFPGSGIGHGKESQACFGTDEDGALIILRLLRHQAERRQAESR